ncbi:extracellular solute-binding protein [Reinekea blandensis]|uniref:ABC-type sugar transport system, periplasmic component n=1 Tax=Reinekea blandensis MED297 TaxID=314283 RepID=A4BJP5_9GAMM|nr:extracellular solute-binding protein [Reinekea blandensis]EAR07685.1 ABC-type sugar transport system, periplasmic component [Reinekea sp. MED297] [Reinekea blandensis MED297]
MKTQLKAGVAALSLMAATTFAADIRIDGFPDYDTQIEAIKGGLTEHNVTMLKNNHGDHHTKLKTNLATGSGAGDVVLIDVGFVGSFVNAGGFVDLSSQFGPMADNYADYAVAAGKGNDGKQYAVPVDLGPGVIYFRRDYMEDMGYDLNEVMTDWDTYIDYGRELKEKDILLIGNASAVANAYYRFNVGEGEGLYFDADGESLVTSERFVRAFELAKTIREEGLDGNISEWTEDWYAGFREGKFATQMSGAWLLGHLKNWIAPDNSGLWGVSHLPSGIYGTWGGSYLAIPKQASNPEAAWDLIEYMISEDIQMAGFENIAAFPAHTGTYDDPAFEEPIEYLRGQKARLMFAEIAENIIPVTPMKGDLVAEDLVNVALDKVLNDGVSIEKALADAERQIKRRVR